MRVSWKGSSAVPTRFYRRRSGSSPSRPRPGTRARRRCSLQGCREGDELGAAAHSAGAAAVTAEPEEVRRAGRVDAERRRCDIAGRRAPSSSPFQPVQDAEPAPTQMMARRSAVDVEEERIARRADRGEGGTGEATGGAFSRRGRVARPNRPRRCRRLGSRHFLPGPDVAGGAPDGRPPPSEEVGRPTPPRATSAIRWKAGCGAHCDGRSRPPGRRPRASHVVRVAQLKRIAHWSASIGAICRHSMLWSRSARIASTSSWPCACPELEFRPPVATSAALASVAPFGAAFFSRLGGTCIRSRPGPPPSDNALARLLVFSFFSLLSGFP